jgi:hypothetical protein
MYLVRQKTDARSIVNIRAKLDREAESFGLSGRIKPGESVAVAVGSRGIAGIADMVAGLVDAVRAGGGEPFIVPAMGSHGGATAAGQKAVLARLGITALSVGAAVRSSMEVVLLGETAEGIPVHCDTLAVGADCVILVNRVKPHTSFSGDIESGLLKMAAVGLGNDMGCRAVHAAGLAKAVVPVARVILGKIPRLYGLAVVENQRGETCFVRLLASDNLEEEERGLLELAKKLTPRLPFRELDLLLVEEMGKNISGTGMDTKVVGRVNRAGVTDEYTRIDKIVVLDLTAESGGNALGIGMADVTTRRLLEKINYRDMYENALSTGLDRAKIPVVAETDRAAVMLGLRAVREKPPDRLKVARIKNTLSLEYLYVSPALLDETGTGLEVLAGPEEILFDSRGNLLKNNRHP